jgi:predicted nucleic acid-binding Zn ribbon protein
MTRRPEKLGDILATVITDAGLTERMAQAQVIPEWGTLVGAQIARISEPVALRRDGTLVVAVRNHAWMNELSLMERELLASLNADPARPPIARLRLVLADAPQTGAP